MVDASADRADAGPHLQMLQVGGCALADPALPLPYHPPPLPHPPPRAPPTSQYMCCGPQRAVAFFESWARLPLHVDDLHLQLGVRDTFFLDPALSLSPGQTARLLVAYAALKHRYGWTQHK